MTLAGFLVTSGIVMLADCLGGVKTSLQAAFLRWGYALVALGFGFWCAHYLFHFLTGAASIVPVFEHFFSYRGVAVDPNWRLSRLMPTAWLFPIGAGITLLYTLLATYTTVTIALRDFGRRGVLAMWPMLLFVLALAALGLLVLGQPMEMRGTIFGPSY